MSDKILRALMQLFAIIANAERLTVEGRGIVESFLKQQLDLFHVNKYLAVFDGYLTLLQGKSDPSKLKKRVSVNSVKVLRICADINSELNQKQKYIVLIRLIEFAFSSNEAITQQESEFLKIVADSFKIDDDDYSDCLALASGIDIPDKAIKFLMISGDREQSNANQKFIYHEGMSGNLYVLFIKQTNILFMRYFGDGSITINGIRVLKNTCYILTQGSVVRGPKIQALYYSDIIKQFIEDNQHHKFIFSVKQVSYRFRNGKTGLHPVSFSVSNGNLIGIMGGSGAGKSTLLNVLNSNLKPHTGEVLINGRSIHDEAPELEGIIGYVPQDDLLMEELTVFQNLYYSSKLCFGHLTNEQIQKKSEAMLDALGLLETKDLKVGSPLDLTISGGQRKRLNIALELIREPAVLFVDEPTSGLSSSDSENVMDLLKQLTIGGTLIYVVIHQPSSDIFKMFDKLLLLDLGGYPVYYGNPSDSLIYFKTKANFADAGESECYTCGNINPDQVFSIIESKIVDEFGNQTSERKVSPEEWNRFYMEQTVQDVQEENGSRSLHKQDSKRSPSFKQFIVFLQRDVLSKLGNRQYLIINLLEAPVLAFILAYFLRYSSGEHYVFRDNMNVPAFIFMSVIVSLFMGLTVSAEEIIRDRRIHKREAFLHLSRMSYFLSKISILFLISAIQTALFIGIGNSITGIHGMFTDYWMVLFSVSCFANLLGLNISASFNEAVTIYILIPFLIIPQILMSGIIVKFENMNPTVTCYDKVPVIGEVMASRWAFEALAVNQYKNNAYEKLFFPFDKEISNASYKKDYWLVRLNDKLEECKRNIGSNDPLVRSNFALLKNELEKEIRFNQSVKFPSDVHCTTFNQDFYNAGKHYTTALKQFYMKKCNLAGEKKERQFSTLEKSGLTPEILTVLKNNHANESMEDLLLNSTGTVLIREYNGNLIRNFQPVYMEGAAHSFIRAPFFVNAKILAGRSFDTYPVNILVMWCMILFLFIALYFGWLKKALRVFSIN